MKASLFFYTTFSLIVITIQNIAMPQNINNEPIKIETTISYLQDLVLNATCHSKLFEVKTIIPSGINPHTFQLTPANRIELEVANIIIIIGSNFEPWMSRIKKNNNQVIYNVTNDLNLKKLSNSSSNVPVTHDEISHSSDDQYHLEYDPHIWQSPKLTKQALKNISKILIKAAPNEQKIIETCTQNYIKTIDTVVATLKKRISTIPKEKRVIATNHDSLGYFADEFGFKIYSILGLSDDSAPTAEQLKNIILEVKNKKIPALFLESTGNIRNIKTVSKETGVKIGGTLYGDSLGSNNSGAQTAPSMWNANVNTIMAALKN
jgi:zinc/manganese transport system substrate-binding protein